LKAIFRGISDRIIFTLGSIFGSLTAGSDVIVSSGLNKFPSFVDTIAQILKILIIIIYVLLNLILILSNTNYCLTCFEENSKKNLIKLASNMNQ